MKNLRLVLAIALFACLLTPAIVAQEGEMNAEMQAWIKSGMKNEHHEHLEALVGTWKAKVTMWMAPGAPAQESSGTAKNMMIMDGRFLQTEYSGDFMGEKFVGMALDGYDNIKKQHIATWMDSMSTMIVNFAGSCEKEGKVKTMTADVIDPMGERKQMKGVTTIISDKEHKYESWGTGPDGKMFKSMEIVYTRM